MYRWQDSWFISDLHLGHDYIMRDGTRNGIIHFERTQFKTIQEHDEFVINSIENWCKEHHGQYDHTLYILGDFGKPSYLSEISRFKKKYHNKMVFLKGNHDFRTDIPKFEQVFDKVYLYPTYIAPRILISHEPQYPTPFGILNICGHLHGAKLDDIQSLCVSINDVNYKPVGPRAINKRLAAIQAPNYKFLKEPYREKYVFLHEKEDVVTDEKGKILLEESIKRFNQKHDK